MLLRVSPSAHKIKLNIEQVQACILAKISRSHYNTPIVWTKWNGLVADNVAHAAGASILSLVRGVFAGVRSACGVRWAWRITISTQPVHRLQIRPIVHN